MLDAWWGGPKARTTSIVVCGSGAMLLSAMGSTLGGDWDVGERVTPL